MYTIPASILGLTVSGDLGGTTIYTDRFGRKTVYPFSPPKEPPSEAQILARERFRRAQLAWRNLTPAEKANLEAAANAAALCLTGQNLFISAILTHRQNALQTIAKQTAIPLPVAPREEPF